MNTLQINPAKIDSTSFSASGAQASSQPPQWAGSPPRSTHASPQRVSPSSHTKPHASWCFSSDGRVDSRK